MVLTKTHWLWTSGLWDLPNPRQAKSPIVAEDTKAVTNPRPIIGTETIISKNIFDPERGAGINREAKWTFNAYETRFCWVLPSLETTDLRFYRMGEFSPDRQEPAVNRSRRCVSSLGIWWRNSGLSEISEEKDCFCQRRRNGRGTARLFSQNRCSSAANTSSGAKLDPAVVLRGHDAG